MNSFLTSSGSMLRVEDPVAHVNQCFLKAEENQSKYFEKCRRWYKLYRGDQDEGIYNVATRSRYVVPVIFKTVETIVPRILSIIFSTSPPIQSRYRSKPNDPQADQKLQNVDSVFAYEFDMHDHFSTFEGWIKNVVHYGQGYLKIGWLRKTRERTSLESDDQGNLVPKQFVDITEDRPDIQLIDIFDLYFSPEATFPHVFETAKWVIQTSRKRKSSIMAMKEAGIYGPEGGGQDFTESDLSQTSEHTRTDRYPYQRAEDPSLFFDDPLVLVKEYWEDEFLITVCGNVLLRYEANPFGLPGKKKKKPFVAAFNTLVPNELFQIGEAEMLEHNQVERSTLRRQRTDNNTLSINGGILYDKNADLDLESWGLARPGMSVGLNKEPGRPLADHVMPIPRSEVSGVSFQEDQELSKDSQETSGLLDYAVGASPSRKETATTVQLLQTAANLRFDVKIRNIVSSVRNAAVMIYERIKQFQTKPIPIVVPSQGGMNYAQITKEDLPDPDQLDLYCPGTPELLMKDARQQKLMQFYEGLRQNPMANPQAALQLFIVALKEAQIDGIESIVQLLEAPMPQPLSQGPSNNGGGLSVPKPPQPPSPSGRPQPPQVNELPMMSPAPSPAR